MYAEIKALRASLSTYGLTKLSTANDVTDANVYALSAIEKNQAIDGTLANGIISILNRIGEVNVSPYIHLIPNTTVEQSLTDGFYLLLGGHHGNDCRVFVAFVFVSSYYTGWCHFLYKDSIAPTITVSLGKITLVTDANPNDGWFKCMKI